MTPLRLGTSYSVAFSPDGRFLATEDQRFVNIWDISSRKKLSRFRPFSWAGAPVFSPDATKLALKSTSGRICVVEVPSGEVLSDFENQRDGEGCCVLWSPDGQYLVDGSWNGMLRVREWSSGRVVFEHEYNGEMIRAISSNAARSQWLINRNLKWQPGMPEDKPLPPGHLEFRAWPFTTAAKGHLLDRVDAEFDGIALSYDGEEAAVLYTNQQRQLYLAVLSTNGQSARTVALGEGAHARAVRWSPDDRLIAASLCERFVDPDVPPRPADAKPWDVSGYRFTRSVVVWNARTFEEVSRFPLQYEATGLEFSPEGDLLAIGAAPGWLIPVAF